MDLPSGGGVDTMSILGLAFDLSRVLQHYVPLVSDIPNPARSPRLGTTRRVSRGVCRGTKRHVKCNITHSASIQPDLDQDPPYRQSPPITLRFGTLNINLTSKLPKCATSLLAHTPA